MMRRHPSSETVNRCWSSYVMHIRVTACQYAPSRTFEYHANARHTRMALSAPPYALSVPQHAGARSARSSGRYENKCTSRKRRYKPGSGTGTPGTRPSAETSSSAPFRSRRP
eukprot:3372399-Rhodomonas_salina.1